MKRTFLQAFLQKCRWLSAHEWHMLRSSSQREDAAAATPEDVPKGHLVVYVGAELKRFVIRASFLDHPLFRALLDLAQEVYKFSPDSKLCIPCDEAIFLGILRCVEAQQERRIWLCF